MSEKKTFTPEEQAARDKLVKATDNIAKAVGELWAKQQGVNLTGELLALRMLGPQLDALVQVLSDAGKIDRVKFWEMCAQNMLDQEGAIRKQIRELPSIVVAPPPPPPTKGKGN